MSHNLITNLFEQSTSRNFRTIDKSDISHILLWVYSSRMPNWEKLSKMTIIQEEFVEGQFDDVEGIGYVLYDDWPANKQSL